MHKIFNMDNVQMEANSKSQTRGWVKWDKGMGKAGQGRGKSGTRGGGTKPGTTCT